MKLITRAQLEWPASAAPDQAKTKGVKVHYEGTAVSEDLLTNHALCVAEWKSIRKSHLANPRENYSDVAYNYAACPHGYLLEGRGIGKRTGANGNQALNVAHYAIVALLGDSGLTKPTEAMLGAIRDGIELLRKHGASDEIKGHRDGHATQCPGDELYAWVKKGAPRPGGTQPAQGQAYEPFPGASFFMKNGRAALGKSSPIFTAMGKRLVAEGCGLYKVGPGPVLGQADVNSYEKFQRKLKFTGSDAKWPPGPTSWAKLKVPKV
ncbi:peptidoglycan-binding protein [Streptomyces hirsutus]|uniref:peptidoglycan-binding protein n=1 Tax=Streptomyces hirsutus TaxID=35620 RepID=UPI00386E2BDC|nr:peptidoglycan-binding protein [Streptomyces hirsutus]